MAINTSRIGFDQIAELLKYIALKNDRELSGKEKKMIKRWRKGSGAFKKSLKEAALLAGFKPSEWKLLDKGVEIFIKQAAKRNNIAEEELYKQIHKNKDGKFILPPKWEEKFDFIKKYHPQALTDKDTEVTISNPYNIAGKLRDIILKGEELYADDLYEELEKLKNKFPEKEEIRDVSGTWRGWSIYPLEGLPDKIFCYSIETVITQENEKLSKVEEWIKKSYDVENDKELRFTPLYYVGKGFITTDNVTSVVERKKDDIFIVFHYVIQRTPFGSYTSEMKGLVSVRVPHEKCPLLAFVKLRKVTANPAYTELTKKEVLEEARSHFPIIANLQTNLT